MPMQSWRGTQTQGRAMKRTPLAFRERRNTCRRYYFAAEGTIHFYTVCSMLTKGSGAESGQNIHDQHCWTVTAARGRLLSLTFMACHACTTSERAGGCPGRQEHLLGSSFCHFCHRTTEFKKLTALPDLSAVFISTRHRHQTNQQASSSI